MIYAPQSGQMKDGCMVYENGVFYLYSMYRKTPAGAYRNIWLAVSRDGVHFEDFGCVVEDFPAYIWAMKVYRGADAFYLNSGSFTPDGRQAVLKFWKSDDLLHWVSCPELDVTAPHAQRPGTRLDCMNVVRYRGTYYGYATGQDGFLTSPDGAHWEPHPLRLCCDPFPSYNPAHGGFEIADCILLDDAFYLFCGGFGHLGMSGYGVYLYQSSRPDGPFTPCLPHYRINGTSYRWVNMWERCFEKDGTYLAHNYMYNGHHYENGTVFLPPVKRLSKRGDRLFLSWWEGNDALRGERTAAADSRTAQAPRRAATLPDEPAFCLSEPVALPRQAVIDLQMTLSENTFTEYSCGGVCLFEGERAATAILFDSYGACRIVLLRDGRQVQCEDVIGFGAAAPYYVESGKIDALRILTRDGMFEIYRNGAYLQTFNNAHFPGTRATPFTGIGAVAARGECVLSAIEVREMAL